MSAIVTTLTDYKVTMPEAAPEVTMESGNTAAMANTKAQEVAWPLRARLATQLASEAMDARLLPVRWESGTRTPSDRSQKSSSSTRANESMPALASGLFSSNSIPSATKFVRANWQSW